MTIQKPKRGRPRNPKRDAQQKARRFYPLEKTPKTIALMKEAHRAYEQQTGHDTSDAEVLRAALTAYANQ